MDYYLSLEKDRTTKLGINHKQKLAIAMVHELMVEKSFEIRMTIVKNKLNN